MKKENSFLLLQIAAVTLLLFFSAGALLAQVTEGAISGTVTDTTGAAIPDAIVTVTNEATGVSSTTKTNGSGFYSVEALLSATYTVRISHPGFGDSITRELHLDPGQRRANNITLVVGKTSTQVTVTADAAQINTETPESGATIKASQIDNLMLNGRNFQTLAISVPGVASVNGADNIFGQGTYLIINGQSVEYTTDTIDGIYNMNTGNLAGINALPIMDGVSEFSVLKDNYGAQYAFAGSGQVVINTKSGTNTFHGSAWDYLRNDAFDADNYFSTSKQELHQNMYGFTLGGPVILPKIYNRDRSKKLFFFVALEHHQANLGSVILAAMPTQAMRNGDFSASPTLQAGGLTLDAHSEALLASVGKTGCITSPTMLNPTCFDPTATALLNAYWPLPNNPGGGFLNYINQKPVDWPATNYQARIDYSITPSNLLTARMMYLNDNYYQQNGPLGASPLIPTTYPGAAWNNLVRLTSTISPRLVNAFTVAQTDNTGQNLASAGNMPAGANIDQAFPGADPLNRMPDISIGSGWDSEGVYAWPQPYSDGEGILQDDVTWVKGNHVLQGGLFYMFGIKRQTVTALPQGAFSFTGVHTGDAVADMLLGLDSTYTQASVQRHGSFHYREGDWYIQDDWRATRRLHLSAGLRWVYFSNDTVSGNQVTTFDPTTFNPSEAPVVNINGSLQVNSQNQPVNSQGEPANLLNGLIFAGQNGVSSGFFTPSKANFGPRVGFNYDLRGNGRSSLHGGYGIGYLRIALGQIFNAFGSNPPFVQTANILNSLLSQPTLGGTPEAPTTQTLYPVPLSFVPSQVQSYSLTYEQRIANNAAFTIAYAGSVGRHLMAFQGGFDENFPLPVSAPSTSNCLAPSQAPSSSYDFDPCINTGLASPDYTRPYAGYTTMYAQYDEGSSNYNSLQSGLTYNTGPSRFTLAYTYSKTLGTIGVHTESGVSQNTVPQNPRDFAAEYGAPAYDFTNNISGTWVYAIPYFAHASKPASLLLGHWTFAGLGLHQSGYAFSPGISNGTNGLAIRPNQVKPLRRVGTVNEWFDTSAYAAPEYGFFGDASNGSIRGPGYTSFNTAIYKSFPVGDRFNIQFRAEAFNVANHPNFTSIDTGLGDGSYGQLNGAGDPRIMEFALKLSY